jgi:hypothetical protein
MRFFDAPDGTRYGVTVSNPGASNAIVVFRHPDGDFASRDRYAWFINHGPEARSVTARLDKDQVLDGLTDGDLAKLFRRSMPVSTGRPTYNPAVGTGG